MQQTLQIRRGAQRAKARENLELGEVIPPGQTSKADSGSAIGIASGTVVESVNHEASPIAAATERRHHGWGRVRAMAVWEGKRADRSPH